MRENNLIPPEPTPVLAPLPPKPKFRIPPIALGILIGLLFAGSAFAVYNYVFVPSQLPDISIIPSPQPSPEISSTPTTVETSEFGTINWTTPVKTTNPDVLNKNSNQDSMSPGYSFDGSMGTYSVGKFDKGAELLVSFVRFEGPGNPYIFRIVKDTNKFYLLESLITDKYLKNDLEKIFDKTKIKFISHNPLGLLPSDYILASSSKVFTVAPASFSSQFFPSLKDPVKIDTSKSGDFYATYSEAYQSSNIFGREVFLKLADSTLLNYRFESIYFSDNRVPSVTFNSTGVNKDAYEQGIPFKCGLGSANTVIKNGNPILTDKQEVGFVTGSIDKKIYQIKNTGNELIQMLYRSYKGGRDYEGSPPYLSIDEFVQKNNHFLFQDPLGDWMVFVSSEYAPMVECGKPVIYLYPPKDTQVTVKVGAKISKSEPLYPQNGWTVLAHPSGQLDYQGTVYPNLFWEGLGHGNYPDLSKTGFVVSQENLVSTIKSHLKTLGLNSRETVDFMDFWADKLPKTPYVRLSWITTSGMNQLAPLSVSPQPDTVIRVFLDFEGLQKPVSLTPQRLTSIPRSGFTLVEWGGLLVGE